MVEDKQSENALEITTEALLVLLVFLAGAGPVFSFFFGITTSQLWSMVEGMQMIVNYSALLINAPGNTALV